MSKKRQSKTPVAVVEKPIWIAGEKREYRQQLREEYKARTRAWRVEYNLAYDGGGGEFNKYYRTKFWALFDAFFQRYFFSYGGSAELYKNK